LGPCRICASNFPLGVFYRWGDTASALAAGCPVIVKSHPMHAGQENMVASAIAESGAKRQNARWRFFPPKQ